MRAMHRAGRVNLILIGLAVVVVFVGILAFAGRSGPTPSANAFLTALVKGDVDKLTDLSYYQGDRGKLKEQWDFAVHQAGKYYAFTWRVKDEKQSNDTNAAVQIDIVRNVRSGSSYPENSEIPMVKVDGAWKVDVRSLDRDIYPALPR